MTALTQGHMAQARDEQRTLEGMVQGAIQRSFPLYTYKEFKRLVRCEYHRFVMQLRRNRTWDEVTSLTGMTRAGLNKLGDTIPPSTHANAMRTLLSILQRAGAQGSALGDVASAFYEEFPVLDDAPELRQALGTLLDEGYAERRDDGRYYAMGTELRYTKGRTDSIVESVVELGQLINEREGPERMLRFTFHVPDDDAAVHRAQDLMKQAMFQVAETLESEVGDAPSRMMTVVYAGGPDAV